MGLTSLHRYVLVLLFCTFVLILEGALATSNAAALFQPGHRHLAFTIGVGLLCLAVWTLATQTPAYLKALTLAPLIAFLPALLLLLAPQAWLVVVHALLAQFIFCNLFAIAMLTAPSWAQSTTQVEDSATPSLRTIAITVPIIMFVQIALGAAFRHNQLGGIPHILGAMISMGVALLGCIFILSQHSGHAALRRGAFTLLSLTLLQIFLGLGAYLSKTSDPSSASTILLTVSHVAVGTLTLAASLHLALLVSKHVRRITIVRISSSSATATL